jgi:hypothetical protein
MADAMGIAGKFAAPNILHLLRPLLRRSVNITKLVEKTNRVASLTWLSFFLWLFGALGDIESDSPKAPKGKGNCQPTPS